MYHVPPSHTRDPRLRRAIALAVVLCSLGAAFLAQLLGNNDYLGREAGVFAIVAYCVLIFGCDYASDRLWTRGLYGLALGGFLLGLVCIAIRFGLLFHFTPHTAWRWKKLSVPVAALATAPVYIWHFCRMASARTTFE